MERKKQIFIWITWIVVWPASFLFIYNYTDPVFNPDVIWFAVLASAVAFFPIIIGDRPIFFTYGISFAVFLSEGLFYEIILTQLGLFMLMWKIRVPKEQLYRLPLNMLMFLFVSTGAAFVYYQLGGVHGAAVLETPQAIGATLGYALVQIGLNQGSIKMISKFLYGKREPWVTLGDIWEYFTSLAILPLGFLLFVLYVDIGVQALGLLGVPLLIVSAILRYLHHSRLMNGYLRKSGEIGQELASFQRVEEVLDIFTERVKPLFDADQVYILDIPEKGKMTLIREVGNTGITNKASRDVTGIPSISRETWRSRKGTIFPDHRSWKNYAEIYKKSEMESVMTVPMFRFGQIVGVITLFSSRKRKYSQAQFQLLKILSNFLAVAIENARVYERLKNKEERCGLTGAFNYRYLEKLMNSYQESSVFSFIMIDIDHFKWVNDTYGHESGNEILVQFARRLEDSLDKTSTVARYGGEEFVVVLENVSNVEAEEKAEFIRKVITDEPFVVYKHIRAEKEPLEVDLTASIGVATYPIHGDHPADVMQKADQAMYTGAKQQGRDRVAVVEA